MAYWGQSVLTLVVNTKVKPALVIAMHNSAETSAGGRSRNHPANIPVIPAFSFRVAKFLNNVLGVNVVHPNLSHHIPIGPR
jgi:hypothetical protein